MDYEKKYEEALERAMKFLNKELFAENSECAIKHIFPELAESEYEKIKRCVKYAIDKLFLKEKIVCDVHKDDVLAWLEKQESVEEIVERCKTSWYNEGKIQGQIEGLSDEEKYQQGWHDALEKQGDKPFDYENANIQQKDFAPKSQRMVSAEATEATYTAEVETGDGSIKALVTGKVVMPKFKVGDFIVNDYCMGKVIELTDDAYLLDTGQGIPFSCEHNAHLWSIEDAKDGDVLFEDKISSFPSPFIVIFKKKNPVNTFSSHCFIGFDGKFYEGEDEHYSENLHPATKEQRDTLEKAITNAGYRWDAEKLELIKVPKTKEPEGTLKQLLDEQKKFYEEAKIVLEDKDTALAFLRRIGIIDEYGELAEKYRSVQTPATTIIAVNGANSTAITDGNTSVTSKKVEKQYCTGQYEPDVREFPIEWKQENVDELSDFEIAMMRIGGSFFGEKAGLDPNNTDDVKEQAKFLLELAPKKEWSEEDEKYLQELIEWIDCFIDDEDCGDMTYDEHKEFYTIRIDWLKSLKERNTWKPSDEQIELLETLVEDNNQRYFYTTLNSLYEQLKKLR